MVKYRGVLKQVIDVYHTFTIHVQYMKKHGLPQFIMSQVSSGLLQTAQTWANAGVCGGLCACAVGGTFD